MSRHSNAPVADALLLTPVQAASLLGIGRTSVYKLIAQGELPTVKLLNDKKITRTDLEAYVQRLKLEAEITRRGKL